MALVLPKAGPTSEERHLYDILKLIFPLDKIYRNVQKGHSLSYLSTGKFMEFDIWIPKYKLCFEFQDAYHYMTTWYYQNPQSHIKQKDNIKQSAALKHGMSLILVPCWWDGTMERLLSSIVFQRPDIAFQQHIVDPIDLNPPENFSPYAIPHIGELMLASFPQPNFRASYYNYPWWMGEKYDGIRFCWNSVLKKAYSRSGKMLTLSPAFTKMLPREFIDSELWFGRGQFSHTYLIVHGILNAHWDFLRVVAFDVPSLHHQKKHYERRYEVLLKSVPDTHPFSVVAVRALCDYGSIGWYAQHIIDNEGEGVILQKCGSLYEHGRSLSLLKLKAVQEDQEAIVVGISSQNAVALKLPNGSSLVVPPHDVYISAPSVGDIVTFAYESGPKKESPLNPRIYRIRYDLKWDEVLYNFQRDKRYLNNVSYTKELSVNPLSTWTQDRIQAYIQNFLKTKVSPEKSNWRSLFKSFSQSKSGKAIVGKFKNLFLTTFNYLFPGKSDASLAQQLYYRVENRRKFFEDYAKTHKFNPLLPQNWYKQPITSIMTTKGANGVIHYHNYSVSSALCDLFPDIGIDRTKFHFREFVSITPENRRKVFRSYARDNGFDPLIPENWYSQPIHRIMATKGISTVLAYHNQSVPTALLDLFPNIGLEKDKFFQQNIWNKISHRRKFFEDYARENKFDPLIPSNWYHLPVSVFLSTKGASRVLTYHNNSLAQGLLDLFPDIGFERAKFRHNTWTTTSNRRHFFENYAMTNGFDPLQHENWSMQPKSKIIGVKGAHNVLSYHNHSISQALRELFPDMR
eukprot:Phypoly_transcript_01052.p1 GENE.Phypoly_transcript_01052~~Phypoly_transcript_01052.p1  ORF type:complete len:797 (-),score=76.09 Phypoly_transcript_01052:124-2514(-)